MREARWLVWVVALVLGCEPMDWDTPPVPPSPSEAQASTTDGPFPEQVAAPEKPALALSDDQQAALDPRASRARPRPIGLLTTEVQGLQSLLTATPNSAADRPALLRRLAEDYVELAASADHDAEHPPLPSGATPEPATERTLRMIAATARTAAIGLYTVLLQTPFPTPYPFLDEVRWYRALEYARAGKLDEAKRAASDVLALSPDSPWAQRARLLLGATRAPDPGAPSLAAKEIEKPAASAAVVAAPTATAATAVPPEPSATTCTMDMDCEGMSVCRDGACVRP